MERFAVDGRVLVGWWWERWTSRYQIRRVMTMKIVGRCTTRALGRRKRVGSRVSGCCKQDDITLLLFAFFDGQVFALFYVRPLVVSHSLIRTF